MIRGNILCYTTLPNSGWYQALYNKIGHGMLVYRINYEKDKVNMSDHVNDNPGKPGMTIVPADGLLVTSYNKNTHPNNIRLNMPAILSRNKQC